MLLLGAAGCWLEPPQAVDAKPAIYFERHPSGLVSPRDVVRLSWREDILVKRPPRVEVDGGPLDPLISIQDDALDLVPRTAWPEGAVSIAFEDGDVEDAEGLPRSVVPVVFTVSSTEPARGLEPELVVRRPVPGSEAPSNLTWISLAGAPLEVSSVTLMSKQGRSAVAGSLSEGPGARAFRIQSGPWCEQSCVPDVLRIVAPTPGVSGPLGEVRTGTAADWTPPFIESVKVSAQPGRLVVDLSTDEPVLADGEWNAGDARGGLGATSEPGWKHRLVGSDPAPPALATVRMDIRVEDLGGNTSSTVTWVEMPPPLNIRITELVPAPRRDWGDSKSAGEPFDNWPGGGTVSSADEWVELVNFGGEHLDARGLGLELRCLDGSPATTMLDSAPAARFGDGGSFALWAPGEALVVRTRGDMAQTDLVLELWAGALLLDRVRLGQGPEANHPGGSPPDLDHESVARTVDGRFAWCRPTPGDPSPSSYCRPE